MKFGVNCLHQHALSQNQWGFRNELSGNARIPSHGYINRDVETNYLDR